ncbi:hypothetical protein BT67DRAFT_434178 [Trichocladium antarcticum]|uniref:Uncharacterized protein n=1 Tax=Trichocladium antarcticum TaxID=1450529 RepID=A0AAN6UJQ4_9PEZI|nr:hypothetical protein BT67DRAFT_434178 [Trichocladium antarcticum]
MAPACKSNGPPREAWFAVLEKARAARGATKNAIGVSTQGGPGARNATTPQKKKKSRDAGPGHDSDDDAATFSAYGEPCLRCVRSGLHGSSSGSCLVRPAGPSCLRCHRTGHPCRPLPAGVARVAVKFLAAKQDASLSAGKLGALRQAAKFLLEQGEDDEEKAKKARAGARAGTRATAPARVRPEMKTKRRVMVESSTEEESEDEVEEKAKKARAEAAAEARAEARAESAAKAAAEARAERTKKRKVIVVSSSEEESEEEVVQTGNRKRRVPARGNKAKKVKKEESSADEEEESEEDDCPATLMAKAIKAMGEVFAASVAKKGKGKKARGG